MSNIILKDKNSIFHDNSFKKLLNILRQNSQNIVLIDGCRGSGKSAFMDSIKDYAYSVDKEFYDNSLFFNKIDATLVSSKNKFITVILANVLNILEKNRTFTELNHIKKVEFDNLINNISLTINSSANISDIQKAQLSLNLKYNINHLLSFIELVLQKKYLIIFIDNLDINFVNQLDILEGLRRYFKGTKIQIVISASKKQIVENIKELDDNLVRNYINDIFPKNSIIRLNNIDELINIDNLKDFFVNIKQKDITIFNIFNNFLKNLNITTQTIQQDTINGLLSLKLKELIDLIDNEYLLFFDQTSIDNGFNEIIRIENEYSITILGLKNYEYYMNIAQKYFLNKEYEKAIEYYEKIMTIYPNDYNIYAILGTTHYELGEFDKAVDNFKLAIELIDTKHKDNFIIYDTLGSIYFKNEDFQQAIESYEKALKYIDEQEFVNTYNSLATLYYKILNYEKAIKYYKKDLALIIKNYGEDNKDSANAYNNLATIYYSTKNYDKAISYYNKSLQIIEKVENRRTNQSATIYCNIGTIYYNQQNIKEALLNYAKAVESNLNLESAYDYLIKIYHKHPEYQNDIKDFILDKIDKIESQNLVNRLKSELKNIEYSDIKDRLRELIKNKNRRDVIGLKK